MSAAAVLTIPLKLVSKAQWLDATRILGATAGGSDVAIDPSGSSATMHIQFPGSIDGLMSKLRAKGLSNATSLTVAVPVKQLVPRVDHSEVLGRLNASPAISSAAFDGRTVTATIAPETAATRYMFEELLQAGLIPEDVPAPAYPWEYVL